MAAALPALVIIELNFVYEGDDNELKRNDEFMTFEFNLFNRFCSQWLVLLLFWKYQFIWGTTNSNSRNNELANVN